MGNYSRSRKIYLSTTPKNIIDPASSIKHPFDMNSKEANSKAQSSSDSQTMRATARSKLMEEAKMKADLLIELYPQFEFKVEEFPEKVRKHNQGIFNDWKGLLQQMYRLDAITKKSTGSTASKSARGEWYVSSRSEDDLPHTIYSNRSIERAIRQLFNANQAAAE